MIKILVVDGVETRRFTVEFEVSGYTFDYWKNDSDESDEQYIERLVKDALNRQGLRMSE
jgi:hypothetical protein